jgi:hypothetical protein
MSPDPAAGGLERERRQLVLRLVFVATFGFTVGTACDQALPFLAPLFAVQMIVSSRTPLRLVQGLAFPILVAAASGIALRVAQFLIDRPVPFVLVVGVVMFLAFLLDAQRRGGPFPLLLLVTTVALPVFANQSVELAQGLELILFIASLEAVLLAWMAHAFFPAPSDAEAPAPPEPFRTMQPARIALGNTLILLTLFVSFLLQGNELSTVVLITVIMILRQPIAAGPRAALGLLLGNVLGGLAALVVYNLVTAFPSLVFLLLLTLLVALLFAARIVTAGAAAPVYVVALTSFLILLGLGLAPTQAGSGEAFVSRLINVFAAVLYSVAAISVVRTATTSRDLSQADRGSGAPAPSST